MSIDVQGASDGTASDPIDIDISSRLSVQFHSEPQYYETTTEKPFNRLGNNQAQCSSSSICDETLSPADSFHSTATDNLNGQYEYMSTENAGNREQSSCVFSGDSTELYDSTQMTEAFNTPATSRQHSCDQGDGAEYHEGEQSESDEDGEENYGRAGDDTVSQSQMTAGTLNMDDMQDWVDRGSVTIRQWAYSNRI